ncbi:MAG TPA: ABC transporter ATP-binding protein [Candidatus Brachybacterium merdavium]|uniref:ABC transporter ATP-binding protein n=1 Tax=Candidatus Brachybacterium merdavium TaxID=2838513 RepID=A0A9D2RND1_9MICO|nr:ABC transporter ATP-binding protein [Candidatus Brachybacterium merdavium]
MLLDVSDLVVDFSMTDGSTVHAVKGLDLQLPDQGATAVIGESGSGKSVSMRAILGLLPSNAKVAGSARLELGSGDTVELIGAGKNRLRRIRGQEVGMVFQNAMDALNPSLTLERQLTEAVLWHGLGTRQEARRRAVEALGEVGIPEPERRVKMYPFQLSGGMRQRAMIAMATITRPSLVIADEPTTALDVTVQKQILDLLVHLQDEGMALVMITHDLGVARYLAQDGVVLREGEVRERGPMRQLLTDPEDSYTRMLLESAMDIRPPEPGDPGAQGTPARESATPAERLEDPLVRARGLVKEFPGAAGPIRAVDDVSFELPRGGTLGIVGESGSGKSTLARLVLRLIDPTAGEVHVDGRDVLAMGRRKLRLQRRSMQMVFQSPYGSLLPASTVAENISEPLRINRIGTKRDRRREALDLLDRVQLPTGYADLYPRQLSGGEQQRVAIARALALEPGLLVADEPTSALDASVQAQVLELLDSLRRQLGFSILLITHNLAVVEKYTDHVMVMKSGRVVEAGTTADIFTGARHDYTRTLLDAVLPVHADAL